MLGLFQSAETGRVGLSGRLSIAANNAESRAARAKADRRHVRWWRVKNWFRYRWREFPDWCVIGLKKLGFLSTVTVVHGVGYLTLTRGDGTVVDYGVVSRHTIATAGKNYVAACFDNTNEPENFKYHGFGTGTNAAAAGDTALQTELTTQYATDSTRPTGSQAHSGATYTTVGTLAPDSGGTIAVTEWGLFSASSSTTLLDHQVFSAVNLVAANGDTLAMTYVLTIG